MTSEQVSVAAEQAHRTRRVGCLADILLSGENLPTAYPSAVLFFQYYRFQTHLALRGIAADIALFREESGCTARKNASDGLIAVEA